MKTSIGAMKRASFFIFTYPNRFWNLKINAFKQAYINQLIYIEINVLLQDYIAKAIFRLGISFPFTIVSISLVHNHTSPPVAEWIGQESWLQETEI